MNKINVICFRTIIAELGSGIPSQLLLLLSFQFKYNCKESKTASNRTKSTRILNYV